MVCAYECEQEVETKQNIAKCIYFFFIILIFENCKNRKTVNKIFECKRRPSFMINNAGIHIDEPYNESLRPGRNVRLGHA
jgi:hypothetical protein